MPLLEFFLMAARQPVAFLPAPAPHWVGDGFYVVPLFSDLAFSEEVSPFLMLDYAAPYEFPPREKPPGVGAHPHRGFETVTIVYHGEIEHRDSAGNSGTIGPGDVQWMTAGSGLLHEEFHSRAQTKRGGLVSMAQLWVNLPAKDKMTSPRYQAILDADIPKVPLPGDAGMVRVIAGECLGSKGPAKTFSPMNVWDVRLNAGSKTGFEVTQGYTTAFLVLEGCIQLSDGQEVSEAEVAVFDPAGTRLLLEATRESKILFLNGQPLNEPIVGYGPFVMNTEQEIRQAFRDYQSGKMGKLTAIQGRSHESN